MIKSPYLSEREIEEFYREIKSENIKKSEEINQRWKARTSKTCRMCKQEKPLKEFHPNIRKGKQVGWNGRCRSCRSIGHKEWNIQLKTEVMSHYSKGIPQCRCCGQTGLIFLNLDHINNNGAEHRRQMGKRGSSIKTWNWLKRNNYPDGFQVLCWNCNLGKHLNGGVCPHEEEWNLVRAGSSYFIKPE